MTQPNYLDRLDFEQHLWQHQWWPRLTLCQMFAPCAITMTVRAPGSPFGQMHRHFVQHCSIWRLAGLRSQQLFEIAVEADEGIWAPLDDQPGRCLNLLVRDPRSIDSYWSFDNCFKRRGPQGQLVAVGTCVSIQIRSSEVLNAW